MLGVTVPCQMMLKQYPTVFIASHVHLHIFEMGDFWGPFLRHSLVIAGGKLLLLCRFTFLARGWRLCFSNLVDTNQTIARLTTVETSWDKELPFLSFILVPFVCTRISYSCRCQAKRMYLVIVVKATKTFLSLYFLWGILNTGAGRPAVSPQSLGRFHRIQFKIKWRSWKCLKHGESSSYQTISRSGYIISL